MIATDGVARRALSLSSLLSSSLSFVVALNFVDVVFAIDVKTSTLEPSKPDLHMPTPLEAYKTHVRSLLCCCHCCCRRESQIELSCDYLQRHGSPFVCSLTKASRHLTNICFHTLLKLGSVPDDL